MNTPEIILRENRRKNTGQCGLSLRGRNQGCSQRGTHNHAVPDRDFFMERRSR